MNLRSQIETDLITAMRSGDELHKRTLRMALSAIKLAEIDKGASLEDSALVSIIQKEIKSRRESIEDAERAGRADLVAQAEAELGVLNAYLPRQLTQDEIESLANDAIAKAGATSPNDMGQVMKILMPRLKGQAEGSQVSQLVRELLERKA
jgi:uncharacterized protein